MNLRTVLAATTILALAVVSGSLVYSTLGTHSQSTVAKTALLVTTSSIVTSNLPLGLRLGLRLSTNSSGLLVVEVDEFNTVNTVNNVTAEGNWPPSPPNIRSAIFECPDSDFPLEFGIIQGNYDLNNYTAGAPLKLYNQTSATSCPGFAPAAYYLFNPLSNGAIPFTSSHRALDNESISIVAHHPFGYWTGGYGSSGTASFHTFSYGTYTVVAEDEWGQVMLLHFQVKNG